MNSSILPVLRYSRFPLRSRTHDKPIYHLPLRIRNFSNQPSKAMTTPKEMLAGKLNSLRVAPLHIYPNCHPEINPVDIYRAHLTNILADVTGVDAAIIYPALQWTQTLEKGDLVLPVPALRVKGKKPPELAAEWAEKVCSAVYKECGSSSLKVLTVPGVASRPQAYSQWYIPPVLLQSRNTRRNSHSLNPHPKACLWTKPVSRSQRRRRPLERKKANLSRILFS